MKIFNDEHRAELESLTEAYRKTDLKTDPRDQRDALAKRAHKIASRIEDMHMGSDSDRMEPSRRARWAKMKKTMAMDLKKLSQHLDEIEVIVGDY